MSRTISLASLLTAGLAAAVAGCGGSGNTAAPTGLSTPGSSSTAATRPSSGSTDAGALRGEANAAATGDIPDNQVFLTFRNASVGWSMKYPEGWAQRGSGNRLTFKDKNNIVRVVIVNAPPPTVASIRTAFASLKGAHVVTGPTHLQLHGSPALKVVYTTQSAPNPVTGKRVTLQVDRYYLSNAGKEAIVDLGTPKGVDNVDGYRLMIESIRWR